MDLAEVHELVGRVASVDAGCADRVVLEAVAGELRRLRSWVDGREVSIARSLAGVSSFPEKSLADASRSSLRQAEQVLHRAETAEQAPEFGLSLDGGRVSGAHVDVFGRALRQLEPDTRARLLGESRRLVLLAEQSTPDEFARTI
ncbi:MAG: hypothetical protein ACXVLM_17925, partial [Ilumatobacteraceae bacterium]